VIENLIILIFINVVVKNTSKFLLMFIILFSGLSTISFAQEEDEVINQLWLDYFFYYLPREGVQVTGDLGYRNRFSTSEWNQFIARGNFLYRYKSWLSLFGGFGFFFTAQSEITNTLEIRPWVGFKFIVFVDFLSHIRFTNFTRIEGRFVINTQESGSSADPRFRNRTDMRIPITNYLFVDNTLYTRFEVEFFTSSVNIIEQSADRIRLGVGLGYKFDYVWRVEFHYYVHLGNNEALGGFDQTESIWRVSVRHYLE
jgi:hypothetical protein